MTWTVPLECPVPWTEGQEKALKQDYPLVLDARPAAQEQVVKLYLEYLWLPESLMPLCFFVAGLRRLLHASASPDEQHALVDPILLTARGCSHKYGYDIPEILALDEHREELEMEEALIWYAFNHENEPERAEGPQDTLDEDEWRSRWLDRMEKRETQIQVLLHLLKLSLPPPSQPPSSQRKSSPSKRKAGAAPPERAAPSTEDRLESLMDRLSRWQLMSTINSTTPKGPLSAGTDDRDWTQRFCEDVVEPSFASQQQEMCILLRSKVFPHTVFSDDEFDLERPATPSEAPARKHSKAPSRAPSRLGSIVAEGRALSRARSLSAALDEEERSLRRSASISASANAGKRALVREVSMSRSLRAPTPKGEPAMKATAPAAVVEKSRAAKDDGGVTLVEGTPVKREKSRTDLPTRRSSGQGDALGASMSGLLVESTPTKAKGR